MLRYFSIAKVALIVHDPNSFVHLVEEVAIGCVSVNASAGIQGLQQMQLWKRVPAMEAKTGMVLEE